MHKIIQEQFHSHSVVRLSSVEHYSKGRFVQSFTEQDWSYAMNRGNVKVAWDNSKNKFLSSLDSLVPRKVACVKQKTALWMTVEILNYISQIDKHFMLPDTKGCWWKLLVIFGKVTASTPHCWLMALWWGEQPL